MAMCPPQYRLVPGKKYIFATRTILSDVPGEEQRDEIVAAWNESRRDSK
jgi:hypothetical protein